MQIPRSAGRSEFIAAVASSAIATVAAAFALLHASQSTDAFVGAFALLGLPLLLVWAGAHVARLAPGAVLGAILAFTAVCFVETYYEQRLYPGQNSMPGFGIVFLCTPAAIASLLILHFIHKRWAFARAILNFIVSFAIVFAPVGALFLASVVHQMTANPSIERTGLWPAAHVKR
jgi:hypothetical protein